MEQDDEVKCTELGWGDTLTLIERKFGPEWKKDSFAVMIAIYSSKPWVEKNIKECCPELFDLCMEYRTKNTVNGKEMPEEMAWARWCIFEPAHYDVPQIHGVEAIKGAYWDITTREAEKMVKDFMEQEDE